MGKDSLRLEFEPGLESYWVDRNPNRPKTRFHEQTILIYLGISMSFLSEFWEFLRERKKFWLLPIIFVLLLMGGLIVLTQGSAVAPFVYTLF